MNPFDYLSEYDFFLLAVGVLFRFFQVMRIKTRQFTRFSFKEYFDIKHLFRWTFHLLTSLSLLLVIPEIFIEYIAPKYFTGVKDWYLFGSFLLGFAGYDAIKFIERFVFFLSKKAGFDILPTKTPEK